jgi:hypothetical protein
VWHEEEYDKLPRYDGDITAQIEAGALGAFFCHQDDGRLCAGWVGCHDMDETLGLRLAFSHDLIETEDYEAALDYVSPVELFDSGAEAAAHGKSQIENPDMQARRTIARLERKRGGRGAGT